VNRLREPEFKLWLKQFYIRLYLHPDQTQNSQTLLSGSPEGKHKNIVTLGSSVHYKKNVYN